MKTKHKLILTIIGIVCIIIGMGLSQPAFVSVGSNRAKPSERITATFSAVKHSSAWIGFYRVGSGDTRLISFTYLRNAPNGYIVSALNKPGNYNFRLFGDGGYGKKLRQAKR